MSPPPSSEALTPKFMSSTALDSPMDEFQQPFAELDDSMHGSPTTITNSMQPPPLPNGLQSVSPSSISVHQSSMTQALMENTAPISPSQEEAARALELVWTFFQQQHEDFVVEPQEYLTIGKLMEKLKLKRSTENLNSGIRRTSEPTYGTVSKTETIETIH